jgi:chromosome segregation ATPase
MTLSHVEEWTLLLLEYDRVNEEINSTKAELNSWKTEISNSVRSYQQFCDRNIALRNREDELLNTISVLEAKQTELQRLLLDLSSRYQTFKILVQTIQIWA